MVASKQLRARLRVRPSVAAAPQLPAPARLAISPCHHPCLYDGLTHALAPERREFIESWAHGVAEHGPHFERWVRDKNLHDPKFSFITDELSADA